MGSLKLVIFDCDGVLVDSEVISNRLLAEALTAAGLPTNLAQARGDYQGLLLADIVDRAQAKLGSELPPGWLDRYERDRDTAFRRELKPIAGVTRLLGRLEAADRPRCVASQGKLEKVRLSLELTGLRDFFSPDAVFSAYSVERGKPYPDLFLEAAKTMGADPSDCVVIEDSPSGVIAGVRAGMRVLGYAPDSDESALQRAGAEIFWSMDDLPELIGLDPASPLRSSGLPI